MGNQSFSRKMFITSRDAALKTPISSIAAAENRKKIDKSKPIFLCGWHENKANKCPAKHNYLKCGKRGH